MPIIIFILLMLFSPLTYAEECVNDYGGNSSCAEDAEHTTAGDCATLGYLATNCNGQAFLRCPFDESKLRCIESTASARTCAELGFTQESCEDGVNVAACPIQEEPIKYACGEIKEKSCEELGFTTEDKTSWCNKIIQCPNGIGTLCAESKVVVRTEYYDWISPREAYDQDQKDGCY